MERELWRALYHLACGLSSDRSGHVYRLSWIVGVYLWSVVHDRPVSWACRPENWPSRWRVRLPNQSTVSRRLRTEAAVRLIDLLKDRLCRRQDSPAVSFIDGKRCRSAASAKIRTPRGAMAPGAGREATSCTPSGRPIR